jgi:hypothetical protein
MAGLAIWNEASQNKKICMVVGVVLILFILYDLRTRKTLKGGETDLVNTEYNRHIYDGNVERILDDHGVAPVEEVDTVESLTNPYIDTHHINIKDPEKRYRDYFTDEGLHHEITKDDDVFDSNQLLVYSDETSSDRLLRSLTDADYDGPQLEGMTAPIDKFERTAMIMQDAKKQEVYGTQMHNPSDNYMLAELNL